ncbi:MAG TPA: ABC transporter substrate-binding protein [Actinomycetales bacterium]|nr:ABC transporter substrate-binding protein [Actinomycetales bacterium]
MITALVGAALALSACAGDDAFEEGSGDETSAGGGTGETIVVGGANFTEMLIMQAIYVELLNEAGFETETITADNRELYFPELGSGAIDVVPEYAATLAEFINRQVNGEDAEPIATNDADATVEAMQPLAEELGVTILEPAEAADQNGFAVTAAFAEENGLETLTDLGELGQPLVLAATEECPERPFCQPGLEETYGLDITSVLPTGFGSPATKQAVQGGEAQLGLVATTDGTLDQFGLVLLEDDQSLQLADNLVPAVNTDAASDELTGALNQLADVLTTEDLIELNRQVDAERMQAADVARAYLEENGLIGG